MLSRKTLGLFLVVLLGMFCATAPVASDDTEETTGVRYVRFRHDGKVAWGLVEGEKVRRLSGSPFEKYTKTDTLHSLDHIRILVPTRPTKVFALAGNYRDHLGDQEPPEIPQPFLKLPSCLQRHEGPIVLPPHTSDVHYEAEMVVVIGKRARNVSEEEALDHVLGVTCGNDISARIWQGGTAEHKCEECGRGLDADVQWWRAKASDTFGPCGPFILSGVDYQDLDMTLRLNGEVRQKTNTRNQIHGVAEVVSFISRHCTLEPGDLIFTGTPGKTKPLAPGDVVEVEIEGVGVLENRVVESR